MSLTFMGDPRYMPPEHLNYWREESLRKRQLTPEQVIQVIEHAEFCEEHASQLAAKLRKVNAELARAEELIADNGYEREDDEYEDDPPLSAGSVRLINMGVNP